MKTKNLFRLAMVATLASTAFFFACNKSSSSNNNTTTDNNVSTSADDESMVSNETDNLTNDVTLALSAQTGTNGTAAGIVRLPGTVAVNDVKQANGPGGITNDSLICDASIVYDTVDNPKTITITYNGTNCWGNRTRTGSVVLSMAQGTYWEQQGASVSINISNLVITRVADGKSITLNGVRTLTNVSGGNLISLPNLQSITHKIMDSLSITFADSATRVWQVAKQRVFTYDNGVVITTTGIHSDGTNTNVAEWGVNRFGVSFESLITEPKVILQSCDFRLTGGQNEILRSDNITTTITYGLDATGNPTSCPGSGTYYMKVVWTGPNARSVPFILPYF
ncbi:MAG TPA: hypothetical protein VMI35_11780 [Puia sp.]|nr:hypothetical protein [Puia sp.]